LIHALYHSEGETAGLIAEAIRKTGLAFEERRLYRGQDVPTESDTSGLVVMGGPMNVDEDSKYPFLKKEVDLIRDAVARGKPVLGVCLGAQLIAKALGEEVFTAPEREVGWHSIEWTPEAKKDPIFAGLPPRLTVLHWHGDTFDLPKGAVHLARSERCENQAYRVRKNIYAFQFHIEATADMVRDWVKPRDSQTYIRGAGEDPDKLLKETPDAYARLEPDARKVIGNLVGLLFQPGKNSG
jgi:GMP synthase-like glutamine amidotransferase